MKKLLHLFSIIFFLASPSISFAAYICSSLSSVGDFKGLIYDFVIGCFLNPLVYLVISLATLAFVWGIFKYIRADGDDKADGKQFIIWGIVGLFIIISFWGLVGILTGTFGLNNSYNATAPF